jgi:hypothetical protein
MFQLIAKGLVEPTGRVAPGHDLRLEPEKRPSRTKIDDGSRHVRIAPLIDGHGCPLSQAQDLSDTLGIDEVVSVHLWRHAAQSCRS